MHIGATTITHRKNINFLNHDVLNYRPRTVDPDITALWPATELAEGYNFEAINENFVITDNSRIMRVYYVQPLQHAAGMLMAYLPQEKIAFQANLFDTHEPPPTNPDAGHAQLLEPGAAHEPGYRHDRAGARQAGPMVHLREGHGRSGRQHVRERGQRRLHGHGALHQLVDRITDCVHRQQAFDRELAAATTARALHGSEGTCH